MITDPQPNTRRLAISLVSAAVRGDAGAVKALIYAADLDGFGALVHCTLTLVHTLAGQLLTPQGLIGADLWLAETARGHPCAETRAGAELVLAHEAVVAAEDDVVAASCDAAELLGIAVGAYNAVCLQFDDEFAEVLTAAMILWHHLLPQAATAAGPIVIGNVAGGLWGGADPPKLESTGGTLKHRTNNTDPPGPRLAIPPEAQTVYAYGPPPGPTAPAGAPISLRGVAIRRLQDSGVW
jgi:hypothetical protein